MTREPVRELRAGHGRRERLLAAACCCTRLPLHGRALSRRLRRRAGRAEALPGVRYSVYAATFYLTMLFGNFGGSDFIYFQF